MSVSLFASPSQATTPHPRHPQPPAPPPDVVRVSALPGAVRLRPDWPRLQAALPGLGRVAARVENRAVLLQRTGLSDNHGTGPHLLPARCWSAYAVPAQDAADVPSLRIFDRRGRCALTVDVLTPLGQQQLGALASTLTHPQPGQPLFAPEGLPNPERVDATINRFALYQDWRALRQPDALPSLLYYHRVSECQALRLAPRDCARLLPLGSLEAWLRELASERLFLTLQSGNAGAALTWQGTLSLVCCGQRGLLHAQGNQLTWRLDPQAVDRAGVLFVGGRSGLTLLDAQGERLLHLSSEPDHRRWLELWQELACVDEAGCAG